MGVLLSWIQLNSIPNLLNIENSTFIIIKCQVLEILVANLNSEILGFKSNCLHIHIFVNPFLKAENPFTHSAVGKDFLKIVLAFSPVLH